MTKSRLYPYQEDGIRYGMEHTAFLLADDMGLGKTLQALLIAIGKKQVIGFKHCLIVCGVNSVKYNWIREIRKHTEEHGVVLSENAAERMRQLDCLGMRLHTKTELEGMGKRDRKRAETVDELNRAYFLVVNIEAFRNKAFANRIKELTNTGHIGGILFDEIHKCVNVGSKQAQGILNIPAQFKIGMTGTPLINRPSDAYFTFAWLGRTPMNFWQWNAIYQRKIGQYESEDRNLGLLKENFERIMLRRRKQDVLGLPEKIIMEELVEMNSAQADLYHSVADDLLQMDSANSMERMPPMIKILRLRQVTGMPSVAASHFSGGTPYLSTASAKLERLAELVQELVEDRKKVVIFSNWTGVLDELGEYGIHNTLRIDGNVSAKERTQIEELWQSEPEGERITYPVLIGTIDSMGTGMNLNSASNVIFIDEPWTDAKKQQAIDRCHRVGTNRTVRVITLLCRNTVDEDVHDIVLGKKTMAELLVGFGTDSENTYQEGISDKKELQDFEVELLLS